MGQNLNWKRQNVHFWKIQFLPWKQKIQGDNISYNRSTSLGGNAILDAARNKQDEGLCSGR